MVAEVNKIIAGELLNHRSVVIPGVGTLYVAHRGARRLSRQKIAAPRNEIDFRPSEEGVSLVELIRRAAGCDEAQAQAVFGRWLAKTREGEVLTLEGIGILRHRAFTPEPAFAAQLNPAGEEVVTLQPRMNRAVVVIAVAAIVVAVTVFGYIEFAPKSVSRFAAQAEKSNVERPKASSGSAEDGVSAAAVATGGERSTEESAAGPDGAAGPDRPAGATASAEIPQAASAQPTVATASTEVPQTTSARPAAVPQPAALCVVGRRILSRSCSSPRTRRLRSMHETVRGGRRYLAYARETRDLSPFGRIQFSCSTVFHLSRGDRGLSFEKIIHYGMLRKSCLRSSIVIMRISILRRN